MDPDASGPCATPDKPPSRAALLDLHRASPGNNPACRKRPQTATLPPSSSGRVYRYFWDVSHRNALFVISSGHGVRTHAKLPPVDLKSTPLTTRANRHLHANFGRCRRGRACECHARRQRRPWEFFPLPRPPAEQSPAPGFAARKPLSRAIFRARGLRLRDARQPDVHVSPRFSPVVSRSPLVSCRCSLVFSCVFRDGNLARCPVRLFPPLRAG